MYPLETVRQAVTLSKQTRQVSSPVVAPVSLDRFERGRQMTYIVNAIAKMRPKSPKNIHFARNISWERGSPSQKTYCKNNRNQQMTHFRACLAKVDKMKTCLDTVHSDELARTKEPNYKQIISSGLQGKYVRNSIKPLVTRTGVVIEGTMPVCGYSVETTRLQTRYFHYQRYSHPKIVAEKQGNTLLKNTHPRRR